MKSHRVIEYFNTVESWMRLLLAPTERAVGTAVVYDENTVSRHVVLGEELQQHLAQVMQTPFARNDACHGHG
jgi:hypothetical protein